MAIDRDKLFFDPLLSERNRICWSEAEQASAWAVRGSVWARMTDEEKEEHVVRARRLAEQAHLDPVTDLVLDLAIDKVGTPMLLALRVWPDEQAGLVVETKVVGPDRLTLDCRMTRDDLIQVGGVATVLTRYRDRLIDRARSEVHTLADRAKRSLN